MSFRALYSPHPPEWSVEMTLAQLAWRDRRFGAAEALCGRGLLGFVVQDSADLQEAHLVVRRDEGGEWRGSPGLHGGECCPFLGWTEPALERGLALDYAAATRREVSAAALGAALARWTVGVVYGFSGAPQPLLNVRLNLADFCDRLEFDFLAGDAFPDLSVVRAHQLGEQGEYVVLRAASGENRSAGQ